MQHQIRYSSFSQVAIVFEINLFPSALGGLDDQAGNLLLQKILQTSRFFCLVIAGIGQDQRTPGCTQHLFNSSDYFRENIFGYVSGHYSNGFALRLGWIRTKSSSALLSKDQTLIL